MKRLLPVIAIVGFVTIASANFFSSHPSESDASPRAVSTSATVAIETQSPIASANAFGESSHTYAYGLVGAMSLLAIMVTRRSVSNLHA